MLLQAMLKVKSRWAEASGQDHDVVLSSRARLARNLSKAPFPARGGSKGAQLVLDEIFAAARRTTAFAGAAFIKLSEIDAVDRSFLVERHLVSPLLAENPASRGVVIGQGEGSSLMVNEEDHLRLACLEPGFNLREAWEKADAADDALAKALPFAFRKDWGYLTACPTNLGTGLRASALVHLPVLARAGLINEVLEGLTRAGLIARGLYGEGTRVLGDFYQISNATGLGHTEREIIAAIDKAVKAVVKAERGQREATLSDPERARLEDIVYRGVALLGSARLLSFEEAAHHLSMLRLGLSLGWKVPGSIGLANELLMLAQPAHLRMLAGRELSARDADYMRAGLIRERLGRP